MAPSNKNSEVSAKVPAKVETIGLKVLIHCEGCKKKVKKVLQQVDGVQSVNVDASLGKVTVTGSVDAKLLLKKLEKAGKFAEVLPAAGSAIERKGKDNQKDQPKGEKKENKKVRFEDVGDGATKHEWLKSVERGAGNGDINTGGNKDSSIRVSYAADEDSGKNGRVGGHGFGNVASSMSMAQRNIAPRMIERSYFGDSEADYATHIFSDENTEGCLIM